MQIEMTNRGIPFPVAEHTQDPPPFLIHQREATKLYLNSRISESIHHTEYKEGIKCSVYVELYKSLAEQ